MDKVFFANITPVGSNQNQKQNWKIQAGIDKKVMIEEIVPEEHIALAILDKFDNNLSLDSFVKKGDANPDPYERFMQNPYQREDIAAELNREHSRGIEYRIFSSINEAKQALQKFFSIDREIKTIAKNEGISLKQIQKTFESALMKIAK